MNPHQNLFDYYINKPDVYRKLQEDYLRDQKYIKWCGIFFIIFFFAAFGDINDKYKSLLYFGLAISTLQYILLFIDQSNRNFLMHAIDWIESKDMHQTESRALPFK